MELEENGYEEAIQRKISYDVKWAANPKLNILSNIIEAIFCLYLYQSLQSIFPSIYFFAVDGIIVLSRIIHSSRTNQVLFDRNKNKINKMIYSVVVAAVCDLRFSSNKIESDFYCF